ncbi:hypothetical protein MBM_09574 [Drepanopeziza brunnea f. sp. 'multigermtubi' MB_m1]|uniref:Uncharacterized protein n=1 Tax=Marssonina brunnea f. sp. multigermtubi (strain MB_m1) TaxID=1072389 RepID=K1WUH3_MARBU|nr:uncharacterized protein MBM_09574 [Drepanopeziza brunnea f. sp. 'multigermtubi' MB_m1]EKD12253.1 hypothetical protein MBM_09574 [Drepanopeziza brunnea f. sp. 'multigermtubi' MB_m1]
MAPKKRADAAAAAREPRGGRGGRGQGRGGIQEGAQSSMSNPPARNDQSMSQEGQQGQQNRPLPARNSGLPTFGNPNFSPNIDPRLQSAGGLVDQAFNPQIALLHGNQSGRNFSGETSGGASRSSATFIPATPSHRSALPSTATPRSSLADTPRATESTSNTPTTGTSTQPDLQPSYANFQQPSAPLAKKSRPRKNLIKEALANRDIDEDIASDSDLADNDKSLLRKFDREVRINSFMFHSWFFAPHVIRKIFGQDLKDTDSVFNTCKTKFKDNIRTQKHEMLRKLKENMKEIENTLPDVWALDDDQFRDRLFSLLNQTTFHHIWYYLEGIISLEKSEELGQYFIRTVYSNLAVASRAWMRGVEGQGKGDLRTKLMQIYDSLPKHSAFQDLDVSDFAFVDKAKKEPAVKVDYQKILSENVKLSRPPPSKKRQAQDDDPFVDNSQQGGTSGAGAELGGGTPQGAARFLFGSDGAMDDEPRFDGDNYQGAEEEEDSQTMRGSPTPARFYHFQ